MKQIEIQIIDTASQFIKDLLTAHWAEIRTLIDEAPDSKVSIGGSIVVNWQEAAPKVKATISFSKKVTDECEVELNDPNQIQLDIPPRDGEEPPHVQSGAEEGAGEPGGTETQEPQADAPRGRGRRKKATAE